MAKKDYKKKSTKTKTKEKTSLFKLDLTPTQQFLFALAAIVILVLIYFAPIVFENKIPPSTDIIAWKGNAQSIIEARKAYDYTPLWANNVFSGMPAHLISLRPPFEQPARYIIEGVSAVIQWQALYYVLGALGMLLLLRFWSIAFPASVFASLAFIWWPHLLGMLEAGHNSKVQTILLIPLILYSFLLLLRKANLLNFALFTIAFSLAVRAGHYQIVFYTGLVLVFFGAFRIVKLIVDKEISGAALRVGLIIVGLVFGVAMSSFQTLQVREYSQYSIRGGTGEEGSTGLGFDYATQWSLHPGEMYNFIIPRFWGGHSSQLYEGEAVPQLRGRVIPGYWGNMPFTSTTDYLGVVAVFFAVIGVVLGWRRTEVKILVVLLVFSALMAFGRHFPPLYKLFFNLVPFFNKFRVPTMIVVLIMFSNAVLAGIGLHELLARARELDPKALIKKVSIIFAVFVALGALPLLLRNSLPLARPEEFQNYNDQVMSLLQSARFDLLKGDALRMLALVAGAFGLVFVFVKGWLSKSIFAGAIIVLLLVDLIPIDKRYMQQLIPKQQMENYFAEMDVDEFLLNDPDRFRVFPVGELSGQAHWSYFHESIEGYHPAKLRIYQDIRESCLLNGTDPGFQNDPRVPINWNIVNMLNSKYLLSSSELQHPNLTKVFEGTQQQIMVYENPSALPRVFAVGATEVIPDRQARFARLNQAAFQPDSVAIVEEDLPEPIAGPTQWSAEITRYEPNYIDVQVTTDQQTLMVLSEIFYPAGWKADIGGESTKIYNVNHILRGVIVPAGTSTVHFKLEPQSYTISTAMMGSSIVVIYILLVIGLVPVLKRRNAETKD